MAKITNTCAKAKAANRKPATPKAKPTPEQISWNMPIGVAMEAFFGKATKKDFALKNKLYKAFTDSLDQFRDDPAVTTRHFTMAALDLARVSLLAHAEHAQKSA